MSIDGSRQHTTAAGTRLPARIRLSASGDWAELTADDLTETGVVLSTGPSAGEMVEQSHVECDDPSWLLHDYTHRVSAVLKTVAPRLWGSGGHGDAGAGSTGVVDGSGDSPGPASALHLGAGALTLPRWIEGNWPQTSQTVLDIEPELVDFVLEHLPMQTCPENIVAEAAQALRPGGVLDGRRFDVVIVDLFNSADAPEQLISPEFFAAVLHSVTPQGLLLMNLGDEAGMVFARRLVGMLLDASVSGGEQDGTQALWGFTLLTAPDQVLAGVEEGNLVFAWTPSSPFTELEVQRIWAAGPHPGETLTGVELTDWAAPPR